MRVLLLLLLGGFKTVAVHLGSSVLPAEHESLQCCASSVQRYSCSLPTKSPTHPRKGWIASATNKHGQGVGRGAAALRGAGVQGPSHLLLAQIAKASSAIAMQQLLLAISTTMMTE